MIPLTKAENNEKGKETPNSPTLFINNVSSSKNIIKPKMDELPDTIGEVFSAGDSLDYIMRYVSKTVKHDETLIKLILLVLTSAYTPNPLNLALESPQSEGKSYSLVEVSKLFPKEDVLELGGMTPQVLTREKGYLVDKDTGKSIEVKIKELRSSILSLSSSKEDKEEKKKVQDELHELMANAEKIVDLQGKILLFLEAPREDTLAVLRPIMSRDEYEITYQFVDKVYNGGPNITMESKIRGWPVFVYATADTLSGNMWDQIRSRCIVVSPNMTKAKYKSANQLTASKYGSISVPSKLNQENKELQECKNYILAMKSALYSKYESLSNEDYYTPEKVRFTWNPMAHKLEESFPSDTGQNMRDFKFFMSLMEVSGLFALFNRPYFEVEDYPHWIVTKKDLKIVTEIFDNYHFFIKIGELPIKIFESIISQMEYTNETVDEELGFTKKELKKQLINENYPNSDRYIKDNILTPLEQIGIINTAKSQKDKRMNVYVPSNERYETLLVDSFLKVKYSPEDFVKDFDLNKDKFTSIKTNYLDLDPFTENVSMVIGEQHFSDHIIYSPGKSLKSGNKGYTDEKCHYSYKSQDFSVKEEQIEGIFNSLSDEDLQEIASNPRDSQQQLAYDELSKRNLKELSKNRDKQMDQAIFDTLKEGNIFKRLSDASNKISERCKDFKESEVKYRIGELCTKRILIPENSKGRLSLRVNPDKISRGDCL